MAQTALSAVKRTSLGLLALLLMFAVGYPVAAWIGSSVPQNADWQPPDDGIDIMIETNGTHTGIVVPLVNHIKDWRTTFPQMAGARSDGFVPSHLALGWGEREVFLNVPTWADLEASTALRIATIGGDPVMRVMPYVRPAPSEYHRPLRISEDQYRSLVKAIKNGLPTLPEGEVRQMLRGTHPDAAYYDATGNYTLTTTCNSWVGDVLAEAGVAMGSWTPFAGGVMKWIPEPDDEAKR